MSKFNIKSLWKMNEDDEMKQESLGENNMTHVASKQKGGYWEE